MSWKPTSTILRSHSSSLTNEIPALRSLNATQIKDTQIERAENLNVQKTEKQRPTRVATIIKEGENLLQQKRWLEAKKLFEKALRSYPDNAWLQTKFTESRRRYEINARYLDSTFSTLTRSSSLEDQLAIFDEVLLDVDIYHVDRPQYSELFQYGITGLSEALSEDSFYCQNDLSVDEKEQVRELFNALLHTTENWILETEDDLRRTVLWLVRQMRRRTGIPESVLISEFLCSMICSLDAYSASLTPLQIDDIFSLIDGKFVGLGVELKTDQPTVIVRVIPNSPAAECGLMAGDEIVQIDGRPTQSLTGTEIGELLQGYEGESAVLLVRSSAGQIHKITAVRRPIDVPSVEDVHVLSDQGKIGYLKISCFQKTTAEELLKALEVLSEHNIQSLIIDLRQNPGGLLQEAINVSDCFLNTGTIVQTRGRNGKHVFSARESKTCSLPLVVIVDSNSASAAEIFAGAMQENKRGTIVGTQSYGKGTVQAIVQLNETTQNTKPIAGLRLTTEKFYSPNGRAYGGVGIIPDVDVSQNFNESQVRRQIRSNVNEAYTEEAVDYSISLHRPEESSNNKLNRHHSLKPVKQQEDIFIKAAIVEANKLTSQTVDQEVEKTIFIKNLMK